MDQSGLIFENNRSELSEILNAIVRWRTSMDEFP